MGLVQKLKEIFVGDDSPAEPSWDDRLQQAAYTSPGGNRLTFHYEDVSFNFDKRTRGYQFSGVDGTLVTDKGHSGDKYPLRIFFWGADYDREAKGFEALLKEKGPGRLEHPLYGTPTVIPFGRITRRDDLTSASNQCIFEVTFWQTLLVTYPGGLLDPGSQVLSAIDAFNAASAAQFANQLDANSAIESVSVRDQYDKVLKTTEQALGKIADASEAVNSEFRGITDSIDRSLDVLVGQPLLLASQTKRMVQSPARALVSIRARLDAYGNLAAGIVGSTDSVSEPNGNDSQNSNKFQVRDLFASTYVSGSVVSVVNNEFETKTEALGAADELLDQLDAVATWRDDNYASMSSEGPVAVSQVDTGESYQALQEAVALATGFLVQISFTLNQERAVVLDRARNYIELAAELYGADFESKLGFFINSNNLTGSEIIEIPRGRTIVYYVPNT